jgi:CBS-domain-containing membrane protein
MRRSHEFCLAGRRALLTPATTCWVSAVIVVPVLIGFMTFLELHTPLRFLLFPPLAALAYAIFTSPDRPSANMRGIIVAPTLTAVLVLPISLRVGASAAGFALAVLVTMVIMRLLGTVLVPALALAVLIVLLHVHDIAFAISVFAATTLLYVLFKVWKHALLDRWHPRQRHGHGLHSSERRWHPHRRKGIVIPDAETTIDDWRV